MANDNAIVERGIHDEAADAISRLPRDLAVIRMENESILAAAAARPRDYGLILKDIKAQLATFKTFAETAMYAKPVGRLEKCPKCGADSWYKERCPKCGAEIPMKIARGLSIRASEALAEAYGYNKVRTSTDDVPGDPDKVRVSACFVDYQKGRIWEKSSILSKTFRKRNGEMSRIPDDRFYSVTCAAKESILARECINRCVPPGLRSELEACVDAELDNFLDESTVKKIVASFSGKKVSVEMIEGFLGKKIDALTKEDRKTLQGAWNALDQGEVTVDEMFGDRDDQPSEPAKPKGTESLAAKVSERRRQKPQEPQPTPQATDDKPAEPTSAEAPKDEPAQASTPEPTPDQPKEPVAEEKPIEKDWTPWNEIVAAMDEATGNPGPEAAEKRLDEYCRKIYSKPFRDLSDKSLPGVAAAIKRGVFLPRK